MGKLRKGNFIGRNIIKFRHRKNWTQQILVAKKHLLGCCMTREVIASIETCQCTATGRQVVCFAEVFGVEAGALFVQTRPD
jgi:hypothetical protein